MVQNLKIGYEYKNQEIVDMFQCTGYKGIRVCKKNKTVVIVSVLRNNNKNNPYNDSLVKSDGTFIYTGMGRKGDQVVKESNENGKVAFANKLGYRIFYFISYEPNKYEYMGEAVNNGDCYFANGADVDNHMRKVAKFPLKLIK